MDEVYGVIGFIVGFIVFTISYIYCIATYGFLFGVGLGWLPSAIVGFIAGLLWPFVLLAVIGIAFVIFAGHG